MSAMMAADGMLATHRTPLTRKLCLESSLAAIAMLTHLHVIAEE